MTTEHAPARPEADRSTGTDADLVVAAIHDDRPRVRRLLAPLVTLAGTAIALGYVAAVDPNSPGHYPVCPLKALTGWDCPGCGLLRASHDLAHGNLAGALDHNVLVVAVLPIAIVLWVRWLLRAWRGVSPPVSRAQFRRRNAVLIVCLVLVVAFGVVRNFLPYVGSGIG